MMQLELTVEEGHLLREEVQKRLAELDHEIAHTEALNFKAMLKQRRDMVRKFLAKLPEAAVMTA